MLTLGNPYAIARDGRRAPAGASCQIWAARRRPSPEASDPSGRRTLHHFGTLIETDAKLNLGVSGGPLLNLKGEMVGLCVALAALAGSETPAGYAIPVDPTFRRILETLKAGREVEYGFLGIQPVNLQSQEILAGLRGIRVERVVAGTPAARYGLKPDDIITAVNQTPIFDADSLVREVGKLPVEAVARLSVVRHGHALALDVTLSKYPVRGKKIVTAGREPWRGMRIDYASALVESDPPVGGRFHLSRRCGDRHRGRRDLGGRSGGHAPRDARPPGRWPTGPHAQGVSSGRGGQVRPGPASPGP